jgi:CHAT domain-containing protein
MVAADRILTIADIFGMQIDADLVVLSACNTAIGGKSSGEEIVGISRGRRDRNGEIWDRLEKFLS